MIKKRLRSGYTTGACAAAAAKAATLLAMRGSPVKAVEIPFPDSSRHFFTVHRCAWETSARGERFSIASVIKDAGDDPDVTNGAEIVARVRMVDRCDQEPDCVAGPLGDVLICRGQGVGMVSKPGLAVAVGEPAINPVPRRMICEAVLEGLAGDQKNIVEVTISIRNGEQLARKTLNYRLGIIGGLSVLGTTGIVRPVSAEAWTATIKASLSVARQAGLNEVVLSTGRTSEKGVQGLLDLPEEAYAMMGDYLHFSLRAAAEQGFARIHLAGMWAKIIKAAMEIPQTHVRHGALEAGQVAGLLQHLGADPATLQRLAGANTAREIYCRLDEMGEQDLVRAVCRKAAEYAQKTARVPVSVYLVSSSGKVEEHV
ncbi:MAG: cobalt-precorrin-5B (C(1))-methyltransferase [Desulfobacterales bacterium]|nr:cobalt-precorrin-5B (C(1))-methyltransferase [Desulfobacterales bacterium]